MSKFLSRKIVIVSIIIFIIFLGSMHIFASDMQQKPYNKYYTSIRIEEGDTIWSIADRYICDYPIDKRDYINEICSLNNIPDGKIKSGSYIIVSYYSQDIK